MNARVKLLAVTSLSFLATACAVDTFQDSASEPPLGETQSALEIVQPGPDIPATGSANPGFKPVDDAIRRFMRERCVGAAVIGIAYKGQILHNRGFGYKNGPPNAACASPSDPFVGGALMNPDDPIRIGSNSKAVVAAILRKELKKALSAKRKAPVTDADIEALTLLNDELELVSDRVKKAMLAGPTGNIDVLAGKPCIPHAWQMVTIGHLLTHTAGLGGDETAYDDLSKIRDLSSGTKLAQEQQASGATLAARNGLSSAQGANAYFVPPATLEEIMIAQGNRCFANAPGAKEVYSNAGFATLNYVLEHITGRPFVAPNGYPGLHGTSLLAAFAAEEWGSIQGIEHSHFALGARDVEEPRYRSWRDAQSTFYPVVNDDKRPWCLLSGQACDFTKWRNGQTRYNWHWLPQKVDFSYGQNSVHPGTGALAAEAPKYLAFMNKFTVGQPYGGERAKYTSPMTHQHFGGWAGVASWVAQLDGGSLGYKSFGNNRNGTMSFAKSTPGWCAIPKGVDVFFSMNQDTDPKCTEANNCVVCVDADCKEKATAYSPGYYSEVIKEALCASDWTM